ASSPSEAVKLVPDGEIGTAAARSVRFGCLALHPDAFAGLVTGPDAADVALRAILLRLAEELRFLFSGANAEAVLVTAFDAADIAFRAVLGVLAVDLRYSGVRCGRGNHEGCQRRENDCSERTGHCRLPNDSCLSLECTQRFHRNPELSILHHGIAGAS